MKTKAVLAVAALVVIAIPVVIFTGADEEPAADAASSFSAFSDEIPPADSSDDALNRNPPTDRVIRNKRPNPGLEPGLQAPANHEDAQTSIAEIRPLLRSCFEKQRGDFPDARGTATVSFQVLAEGTRGVVKLGEVASDADAPFDEKFRSCIADGVDTIAFTAPARSPINVKYPFVFGDNEE